MFRTLQQRRSCDASSSGRLHPDSGERYLGSRRRYCHGRFFFEDSSRLTYAYIAFADLTLDKVFTFTVPGPEFHHDHSRDYGGRSFQLRRSRSVFRPVRQYPSDPSVIFALSHYGLLVPCGTTIQINADVPPRTDIHVVGEIAPIPEPGGFMVLGTGVLAIFYSQPKDNNHAAL